MDRRGCAFGRLVNMTGAADDPIRNGATGRVRWRFKIPVANQVLRMGRQTPDQSHRAGEQNNRELHAEVAIRLPAEGQEYLL